MAELTDVSDADKLMARYAAQLTIASHAVTRADLDELRAVGFDDVGILDIAQISGCFAHMNRIASGLGVTVRSNPELACELLGEAEWERQQRR